MSRALPFRPKRPRWFQVTAVLSRLSVSIAFGVIWWRGWSAGDEWGLTFGTLAALLMFLGALYPLRRRLMLWPLNSAQHWLQFHIYGTTLAGILVIVHMGLRWPNGQFGWWLLGLTIWTTVSGLMGVGLQKWVPALVAAHLTVEAIYERIPELVVQLQAEAARTMEGASDVLQRFYDAQVQPALAGLTPSWSYVLDARRGRDERLAPFEHLRSFVGDEDQQRLADLQAIVSEKLELEAHYSLQRALRIWPFLHVPPAMLLLGAIVAHVAAVWYSLDAAPDTPGTPSRASRYLIPSDAGRLVRRSLLVAVGVLFLGLSLYFAGLHRIASPGTLTAAHGSIDVQCTQCHQPAKQVIDLRCARCHDPLDTRRFEEPAHAGRIGAHRDPGRARGVADVRGVPCRPRRPPPRSEASGGQTVRLLPHVRLDEPSSGVRAGSRRR